MKVVHGIIKYAELEDTHVDQRVPTSYSTQDNPKNQTVCLRMLSSHFLNSSKLGAMTTALGNQFHCVTTLWWRPFPGFLTWSSPYATSCHSLLSPERRDQHCSSAPPCEEAVGCNEISPQPSLILCHFVLWGLKLHTVLGVRPHQSCVEQDIHFP